MAPLVEIVVALLFIARLLPVLAIVTLLVRMSSPGPVIVWEHRRDEYGNLICVCQFRTTYVDSARITEFGRFLRQSSLDELPVLISLLRGDVNLETFLEGFSDLFRHR